LTIPTELSLFIAYDSSAFYITGTEEGFMPWLLSEVKQEIKQMLSSREILTGLSLFA